MNYEFKKKKYNWIFVDSDNSKFSNRKYGKCEQCGRKTTIKRISIYNEIWLCGTCRKKLTVKEEV